MTEEEAKTKMCHQTFGIPDVRDEFGNGITQGGPWNCCGSNCMAWQWINTPESVNNYRASCQTSPNPSIVATGFCGLAGKP